MTDYTSPDELLAVVDENDREIGAEPRAKIHSEHLLHRAVHVLVFHPDGRLMIQKRSAKKDTFPLCWECVGGHLGPGESYEAAAIREVEEEIGIRLTSVDRLAKIPPSESTGFEFIEIYRAQASEEPICQPDEVDDFVWVDPAELPGIAQGGNYPLSPVFLKTLQTISLI